MKKSLLKSKLKQIFLKHKLSKKHAEICSNYLIKAEILEAKGHGLARLKMYCDRIKAKVINPKPKIKIKSISNSITSVDADNAVGFIGANLGIDYAIKNARKTGIGFVSVKNSGHYGLSGYYAEKAAKKGLIAFCFTNAPPAIAPYGAKKALFGTNPICFAAPLGKKSPFVLDTSITMINRGKIRRAEKLGEKIPFGVALDKKGNPTNNAKKALEGLQLPIAGFRGSGLAWMIDILSGVLTGGNHGGKVKDPFEDFTGPQNIGHLFIVFKPNLFVSNYKKRIRQNIQRIRKLPKLKGIKKIYYPGERKAERYKNNLKKEIKIPKSILDELNELNKS